MGMHKLFNDDYSAPATNEEVLERITVDDIRKAVDRLEAQVKKTEAAVNEFIWGAENLRPVTGEEK